MIDLVRFKRIATVALAVATALAGVLVLRQLGAAVLRSASGADPASVFNEVPPAPAELLSSIRWLPDPEREGREMEPRTRVQITDAYARALAALDRAGRGDADAPLADYFSGPALDAAREVAERTADVATIHVRHDLRLDFYSDDGSVVGVGVPAVEVVRVVEGTSPADGAIVASDEAWRFVMLLEDGNWRVQQLQTTEVARPAPRGELRPLAHPLNGVNSITLDGGDHTWRDADDATAIADLDAAVALGFDSVRVFIAGPEFGTVDVAALRRVLDLAAERDLAVVPVLFDGSADHHPLGWAGDREYIARIVGELADHPAIALWDLKNEPDLDDDRSGGAAIVDAWLDRVAADVRTLDPDTPLTIGWSAAVQATRVVRDVDVVSFHHFGDAPSLARAVDQLLTAIGERPLVVSEVGRPEWAGFVRGSMPAAQAERLADLLGTLDGSGVEGSMVWVLRDPAGPVERGAAASRASISYGLLRHDGTPRPIADVVRLGRNAVPTPTLIERVRGNAPVLLPVGLFALAMVGWAMRRRRVRTGDADATLAVIGDADPGVPGED